LASLLLKIDKGEMSVATLSACLAAIESHLGFAGPRIGAIAKRLLEAGTLPPGGPGRAPELNEDDFLRLVIACAVNGRLRESDETVRVYSALSPGGADLTGAPETIPRTAFDRLAIIIDIALRGDADARPVVRKAKIEFVTSWAEIDVHDYGTIERFRAVGTNATNWANGQHRTGTTISVAAITDAYNELFGDN
jgi:hypothetical protein